MKRLLVLLGFAFVVFSQTRAGFTVTSKQTPSGAAVVVTVQQPTSSSKTVHMLGATVYSSVDVEFTVEVSGTAATTTNVAEGRLPGSPPANAYVYAPSNAGSGNVLTRYQLSAGQTSPLIDLSQMYFARAKADNVTIRTASITGTVIVNIQWEEY